MKKIITIICAIMLIVLSFALVGCKQKTFTIDGDYVIITVDIKNVEGGATLIDYMDYLVEKEELTYEISNGMILSINGKQGSTNEYWMLYTSDADNSNSAWGACIYKDVTYNSASVGAEELPVKDGYVYIWYLQSF